MKRNVIFIFCILIGWSCTYKKNADSFTILGQLSNKGNVKVVLCEMGVKEIIPLDSTNTGKEGTFMFSHKMDQPGFYLLMFPNGRRIILVIEKGEDIRVHGNLMDPDGNLIFSGSVESQLLQDFFMETMKNKIRIDSVKKILSRKEDSDEFLRYSAQADSAFYKISGNQKQLEKDFIDKNPLSLASLIVLNYAFGPKPVLTMEEDFPYYQKLTYLIGKYPKNKHVLFHRTRVNLFLNNLKMQ